MKKKYGLGIHTTTGQLGLGLNLNTNIIRYQTWQLDRQLSNQLHLLLLHFLQPQTWQELAYIAVAKGPGSFTSTRLGIVTARTLGQQLNLPIFSLSSLKTYAWSCRNHYFLDTYLPLQMIATKDYLYGAVYQFNAEKTQLIPYVEDQVILPSVWEQKLEDLELKEKVIQTPDNLGDTVDSLLELANMQWQEGQRPQWSDSLPFYGQFS